MGAALPVLKALNPAAICGDCSKYVLNDCHASSRCCSMCECDVETERVDLPEGESEEFEVDGCCYYHRSD